MQNDSSSTSRQPDDSRRFVRELRSISRYQSGWSRRRILLTVDTHATYREFLLTTASGNLPIGDFLTSDDVEEYSRIEIKLTETPLGDPGWNGIPNEGPATRSAAKVPIVNKLANQSVKKTII